MEKLIMLRRTIDFDGTDTYLSEYYLIQQLNLIVCQMLDLVMLIYDSSTLVLFLYVVVFLITVSYDVRSNIVGFGTTASGIGTYRFLVNNQPAGTEISARLESTNN